ncbi:MAG TPA: carboxypeptidase-like regulatory domain-containing protein, partial [Gemmatimonadales bacterium]|nr:carboxypeptidase-like regulatory domain-containing protein [Gemmatimonadales bacterium]
MSLPVIARKRSFRSNPGEIATGPSGPRDDLLRVFLLLLLALLPGRLGAQVGTTTDVLTGIVRDSAGQPVPDAVVEATSIETQITRTTKTDPRGRYTLLFPDGGGQYRLIVRAIGKTPVMRTVARQADEDRLITNVTLGAPATRLA